MKKAINVLFIFLMLTGISLVQARLINPSEVMVSLMEESGEAELAVTGELPEEDTMPSEAAEEESTEIVVDENNNGDVMTTQVEEETLDY